VTADDRRRSSRLGAARRGFDEGRRFGHSPRRRAFHQNIHCISALQQYYDAMRKRTSVSGWGAEMQKGERIRLKSASPAAREWRLPREAEGTVLCRYRVFAGKPGASERMDVCFSSTTVIWGAPATEFEPIAESKGASEPRR
jgi:hypothetical protein